MFSNSQFKEDFPNVAKRQYKDYIEIWRGAATINFGVMWKIVPWAEDNGVKFVTRVGSDDLKF